MYFRFAMPISISKKDLAYEPTTFRSHSANPTSVAAHGIQARCFASVRIDRAHGQKSSATTSWADAVSHTTTVNRNRSPTTTKSRCAAMTSTVSRCVISASPMAPV